jgi:hypothetical protein
MKDNISLIAAATGGFMLSIAIAGILRAAPVTGLNVQPNSNATQVSDLRLKPVHPDEPVSYTLNERFSVENSMRVLPQIKGALKSFHTLTEKSKSALGEKALSDVGNTDWEVQNLGFANWVSSIEGTIKRQDYQMKKLEFELAKKQYEDKQVAKAVLDQKTASYREAEQEFQKFWNSFNISD